MISTPLRPVRSAHELEIDLRRVASALLQDALSQLRGPAAGHEKAVHETRKRIKELRALLRLVDPALVDATGQPARELENDQLRAAADGLAASRDAAVMLQTLEALARCGGEELNGVDLGHLRKGLERRRTQSIAGQEAGFAKAIELLEGVLARASGWRIDAGDAWEALEPGLKRIYRRGRRAMRQALATSEPAPWHDWRRRAKDLRYAIELLRESAPPLLEGAARAASLLTDQLGEDHDIAVLLEGLSEGDPGLDAAGALARIGHRRRAVLQSQAARTGGWLYAESPSAFAQRVGAYWQVVPPTAQ